MKKVSIIILLLPVVLGFSYNINIEEEFHGAYSGCNNSCERIRLSISSNNKVSARFSSTEFVGHFSDEIEGKYEVLGGDTALIEWTSINKDNTKYTNVPAERDTIILVDSNKKVMFKRYGDGGYGVMLKECEIVEFKDSTNPFAELAYRLFVLALCIAPFYFLGRYFYKRFNNEDE